MGATNEVEKPSWDSQKATLIEREKEKHKLLSPNTIIIPYTNMLTPRDKVNEPRVPQVEDDG